MYTCALLPNLAPPGPLARLHSSFDSRHVVVSGAKTDTAEPLRRFDYAPLQAGDAGFLIHCHYKRCAGPDLRVHTDTTAGAAQPVAVTLWAACAAIFV